MSEHLKEEVIVPFLDGRLSAAERTPVETHLAACAACRAQVEELRAVVGVLGEWPAVLPSPSFDAALRARVAQEAEQGTGWFVLRPAWGAALAAAVVMAAAIAFWPPESTELPPLPQAPGVAVAPQPRTPQEQPVQPETNGSDELAVLDNPEVLDNFKLLAEFDILFEAEEEEEGKTL
ncbi:MAG TPA: zf-HC2 domain-containing protein [Candidatus Acidoferrales bacterium]